MLANSTATSPDEPRDFLEPPVVLKPPQSAVDMVTDRLITAIAVGEYLPGSRLPAERDLSASLKVGRVTVRAALARLTQQGLLETTRGRGGGSFIREQWGSTSSASVQRTLSARWEALLDTFEAVRLLHGTIARAAAVNRTKSDIQAMRARLEEYRKADTGQESQKADEKLHLAIAEAAHNTTLRTVLLQLESNISLAAPAHLWGATEGMREMELRALIDHEQLVEAICCQQPESAGAIGAEHVRIDQELFEKARQKAGQRSFESAKTTAEEELK